MLLFVLFLVIHIESTNPAKGLRMSCTESLPAASLFGMPATSSSVVMSAISVVGHQAFFLVGIYVYIYILYILYLLLYIHCKSMRDIYIYTLYILYYIYIIYIYYIIIYYIYIIIYIYYSQTPITMISDGLAGIFTNFDLGRLWGFLKPSERPSRHHGHPWLGWFGGSLLYEVWPRHIGDILDGKWMAHIFSWIYGWHDTRKL